MKLKFLLFILIFLCIYNKIYSQTSALTTTTQNSQGSTNSVSFGNVIVNTSSIVSDLSVVSNSANLHSTFSVQPPFSVSATSTGPFSNTVDCTGAIATRVYVKFSPTSVGSATGNLSITSNNPGPGGPTGSTTNTVLLSGIAVATPALNISPSALDFGNQTTVSTSAVKTFSISATNLLGNVIVTSPVFTYLVSLDGTNFSNRVDIQKSQFASPQTVYVKFVPFTTIFSNELLYVATPVDNITNVSQTISLKGSGANAAVSLLNPYPSMIANDGSLLTDVTKIDQTQVVKGAATDGVSKILLVMKSNSAVTFSLADAKDGTLTTLDGKNANGMPIQSVNGLIVGVYTSPDGYGVSNPVGGRNITITAKDGNNNSITTPLKLVTPPVILVHGLWGSPQEAWIGTHFKDFLVKNGLKNVFLADYSANSAETFDPKNPLSQAARDAIIIAIIAARTEMTNQGIASIQADVVGHSLGGLQLRNFSQSSNFQTAANYNKGYYHKMITIGTPHLGSEWGPAGALGLITGIVVPKSPIPLTLPDFYITQLLKLYGSAVGEPIGPIGSVIADFNPAFKKTGKGLDNLVETKLFKVHAIASRWDVPGSHPEPAFAQYVSMLVKHQYYMLGKSGAPSTLAAILRDEANDLIVPKYSQLGGLSGNFYTDFYYPAVHLRALGITQQKEFPPIQQRVVQLLLTDSTSLFATGFPAPNTVPTPFDVDKGIQNLRSITASLLKTNGIDILKNNNTTSITNNLLRLISPSGKSIYKNDGKDSITLRLNFTDSTKLNSSLFIVQNVGYIAAPAKAPYTIKIAVPKNTTPGKLGIIALGNDLNGVIYADTLSVGIKGTDTLKSISSNPGVIQLDSLNRSQQLTVTGLYTNVKDTVARDISLGQTGTTYSIPSKKSIIRVSTDGLVNGLQAGTDTVLVSNSKVSLTLAVTVSPNLLMAKKYNDTITLKVNNINYGDVPFVLNGNNLSGSSINYNLISGPVTLANGVLTITGAGPVKLVASSLGNTYFNAAKNDTVSFNINPALITVTADSKSKFYSDANPALSISYSGFVNGDTQSILTTLGNVTTTATTLSAAGNYPIAISGTTANSNYKINFVAGLLTIIPAPTPSILSVSPSTAISGTTVTITGTYFIGTTAVTFGGAPASSFNVVSATMITAVVGLGSSGNMAVTTPSGTATISGFSFVFSLLANNFKLTNMSASCKGSSTGNVTITAVQNFNYTATITGNGISQNYPFTNTATLGNLSAGTYNICITVSGQSGYQQCFTSVITEPKDLSLFSSVNKTTNTITLSLAGNDSYSVMLNGAIYKTTSSTLTLPLSIGSNKLVVSTDKLCQGIIEQTINTTDNQLPYPNPFSDLLNINLGETNIPSCTIKLYGLSDGRLLFVKDYNNISSVITIDVTSFKNGFYSLHVITGNKDNIYKLAKQ